MPIDSNAVRTNVKTITRINTAIALFGIVGVAALFIWMKWFAETTTDAPRTGVPTNVAAAPTAQELESEYKNTVNQLLAGFAFDDAARAEQLQTRVLALRVPAALKQMHLSVIVALQQAQKGNFNDAQHAIQELSAEYTWFLAE